MKAALVLIVASLGLAGCAGSPPPQYHSLSAIAVAAGGSGSARMLVEILPPVVPERLNRQEMVLTSADGRLDVRELEQWAAPLPDEVRQVVADTLWADLGAADVYNAPVSANSSTLPQYRLALRLEHFDAVPGHAVRVEAAWTIRRLPQGASITCRQRIDLPLPGVSADAAAGALGQASAGLAKAVSASLGRMNLDMPDACEG
jgi:hypothetical protein